ncbi:hypothetical protein Z517_00101 [Fonsecaea pedrosoi CBS 271.37]|uniref:Unplaced genomic scaffold supercont1.1, whole genome shotgun sequence n=1 Tax=Fonsecaea pedrosoi CBS 271.37 TaxID=1442368 RepID=A0A0D2GUP3_9EURO|nr:uncharacterized protein Z517_00101 [Fonsecaea pedrosoi CBS 271.37]KIW84713.1 hypothetical protein Z517_00101 [Fonsecaea pedrosoi CBS 271.37]
MSAPPTTTIVASSYPQISTSTLPAFPQGQVLGHGEGIDSFPGFHPLHQQAFGQWPRQFSAGNMWQQDYGLCDGFWGSGAVTTHQFASPMSIPEHMGQHPPSKGSTPAYMSDELPHGMRLGQVGDGVIPVGGEEPTQGQERQRSEAADSDSGGTSPTRADAVSASEEKRKIQNRQAQRAFRQRRVKYVRDLEKQVKDLLLHAESLKHENQMLRERCRWLNNQLKSLHCRVTRRTSS